MQRRRADRSEPGAWQRERPPTAPHERADHANAFMADPEDGPAVIDDDLAESMAEEFLRSATTGEDTGAESHDQMVPEELGGPFVETTAAEEFADGPDPSNPEDATTEALPTAVGGLVQRPRD